MSYFNGRKKYIDISKGIGIFSIVLVHLTVHASPLSQILLSFNVPFFFIISGILFSVKKEFNVFLYGLLQKLIVPLVLYGCLDAVFTAIYRWSILAEPFTMFQLAKIILKITFVTGSANSNGPLWFLPVLFLVEFIMFSITKVNDRKSKVLQVILLVIMFIMGGFISLKGVFRIGQVPVAFVFFELGYFSKSIVTKLEIIKGKFILCVFSFIVFGVLCYVNGFSEMAARNYGNNYVLYYLVAIVATVGILLLAIIINENRLLEFYGRNSLIIMCCHFYITAYIVPFLFRKTAIEATLANPFIEIFVALVIMVIMLPIVKIIERRFPLLSGKYKIRKFLIIETDFKVKKWIRRSA